MDVPTKEFVLACSLEELREKGRLVLHGNHRPILVLCDHGRAFALDNRCQIATAQEVGIADLMQNGIYVE